MTHDHGPHGHDHGQGAGDSRLTAALALTAGFMGVEVIAGLWTGSLALIADAGHMLTDAASLALALVAARASRRRADALRTYCYGRARVLAAFVNGLALFAIAAWIVLEAASRLAQPAPILAGPMLVVAVAGLGVNLVAFLILRGGADINTRGALAHVVSDLLGSLAAIVAASVILATGWTPADPLLSILVAALIVRTGWNVTRESAHALLEGAPAGFEAEALQRSLVASVPLVRAVHHVHAWTVDADDAYITLHVEVDESVKPDPVIEAVRAHLVERHGFHHVTVQVEHACCEAASHEAHARELPAQHHH
jgi:cobalt-zinc-cadmium efflux system protein